MKYFMIAAFLVILTLQVTQASDSRCHLSSDCGKGECCIARFGMGFRKGDCKELASLGEPCSHEDDKLQTVGEKYVMHCPCASGLSCEPEETKDLPFIGTIKINERCVEGTTTEGEVVTEATEGEVTTEATEGEVLTEPAEE